MCYLPHRQGTSDVVFSDPEFNLILLYVFCFSPPEAQASLTDDVSLFPSLQPYWLFSLCLKYATFTPTSGPLHCSSLFQEALESLFPATQILISVPPFSGGPPCPSVSRTHSLFPHPISSLTPAWQYLKVFRFFSFAFCRFPSFQ